MLLQSSGVGDLGDGDYGENVFIDKPGSGVKDSGRDDCRAN